MNTTPIPLNRTWKKILNDIITHGDQSDLELVELRNVTVSFSVDEEDFRQIDIHGLADTIVEMRKVFFSTESNSFGHSYRNFWQGPEGRSDFSDVIEMLQKQPATKKALLALVDPSGKKVPCLNAVHFLLRNEKLELSYFARGQDVYLKFCADAVCVHDLGCRVARALGTELRSVTGTISSAHIYRRDLERVAAILNPPFKNS